MDEHMLSFENEVFAKFAFYAGIVLLKTIFMSVWTARFRFPRKNEVFAKFAFYAGIVLLKTIFMSVWTARFRIPRKVFITPEDYGSKKPQALTQDPDVERTRRCHQNDLENVLPFVLIGLLYVLTGPDVGSATLHFRLFAGFRLLHTIAYMFVIPQPTRVICFFVGFGVNVSMCISVIKAGMF